MFSLIIFSKPIPIVADKVELRDETFVADHLAGPLPVSHTVADLERKYLEKIFDIRDWVDLAGVGKSRSSNDSPKNRSGHFALPVGPL